MGKPQGSYIRQSFSLSSNGTFSVSDDHGNSYSFTVPVAASGLSTSTLVGNSTTAVFESRVTAASVQLADVKLTFSVYDKFCQPAGVRVVISGTEDWGPARAGVIGIRFGNAPISHSGHRAWFGNSSGVALGFDWSDSAPLSPAFSPLFMTLNYTVGPSFTIDPVTIGSGSSQGTAWGYQGHVFYAQGLYWAFYSDGSNYDFRTSLDGLTWSAATSIRHAVWSGGGFSVWYSQSADKFYYAVATAAQNFAYNYGTPTTTGAISWGTESLVNTGCGTSVGISIATDSNGNPWVAVGESGCSGTGMLQIYEYITSWSMQNFIWYVNTAGLIPLTAGKMAVLYQTSSCNCLQIDEWSGSAWTRSQGPGGTYYVAYSGATAVGDTVYVAASLWGTAISFMTIPFGGPWSYDTYFVNGGYSASVSTDASGDLVVFATTSYCSATAQVVYKISRDGGSTWPTEGTWNEPCAIDVASPPSVAGNLALALWTSGTSSPYNIGFSAIPINVQDAALSSDPWSRPGLSPYESYFSEFSDYVSPGNGLVSVGVGTFSLPGRGIDFAPSLVYSEPYAFRSGGSPYLFDNYTGASLGYGWSLNLPWMGANYLHLNDGQAFPYSWVGDQFVYHGEVNFNLTKNSDGSYALSLPDGTRYSFNSAKQLVSETDRTENNAITFSYGSNGYLSQITDTVGRNVPFSYNSNNQLVSISEGGRTWTLGYTGSQLTSVTDPLDRVTSFQYAGTTGADAWLLSAVQWPTGGRVAYVYGSAPVGTEVSTYYATLRDVYYDSTGLSLTQQINPVLVNGQMVWSNNTISDGTTIREYLDYSFQPSKGLTKVYA